MCWCGSLCVRSKRVLNDVGNICSYVVGAKQLGMQELYERRALKKARQILNDKSHVLAVLRAPTIYRLEITVPVGWALNTNN